MELLAARLRQLATHRDMLDVTLAQQWTPYASTQVALPLPQNDLLQLWLLHATPAQHAKALLEWWAPPPQARVLDCGCGTGALARYAQESRPDIAWRLLGHNWRQLCRAQAVAPCVLGDMHALPLRAGSVEGVVLSYTLGYGFAPVVFLEVARILTPGGSCLLYDAVARTVQADETLCTLGYKCYPFSRLRRYAAESGLQVRRWLFPEEMAVWHPQTAEDVEGFARCAEEIMPIVCCLEKPYAASC
jgi:SAM-dependent methyltransferase